MLKFHFHLHIIIAYWLKKIQIIKFFLLWHLLKLWQETGTMLHQGDKLGNPFSTEPPYWSLPCFRIRMTSNTGLIQSLWLKIKSEKNITNVKMVNHSFSLHKQNIIEKVWVVLTGHLGLKALCERQKWCDYSASDGICTDILLETGVGL